MIILVLYILGRKNALASFIEQINLVLLNYWFIYFSSIQTVLLTWVS